MLIFVIPDPRQLAHLSLCMYIFATTLLFVGRSGAQSFIVDFNKFSGPNCVKDFIGVYQTPFLGTGNLPSLTNMGPFLKDAGVHDLRYEIGWGKPDAFAYSQIMGTQTHPIIDFSKLDPFVRMLQTNGIRLLFVIGYDPDPLKICSNWECWKDVPDNMNSWRDILQQYSAHYSHALGFKGIYYEIWNEPDLFGHDGKVFFNGTPSDYGEVYSNAVMGINKGASDAKVGGPAVAYDTTYLTQSGILKMPLNFVSIHAYSDAPSHLSAVETELHGRRIPIFMTEYGSYPTSLTNCPWNYHAGAAAFFNDVKMLLSYSSILKKVYWAQWIDNKFGMITYSLHKKAIYNAYKIYQTMLPVDRNVVSPDTVGGINTLAASDNGNAGIVIWNTNSTSVTIAVELTNLPSASGMLRLFRIDASHASYLDNSNSENLTTNSQWKYADFTSRWKGSIPAQSVVFIFAEPLFGTTPGRLPTVVGERKPN